MAAETQDVLNPRPEGESGAVAALKSGARAAERAIANAQRDLGQYAAMVEGAKANLAEARADLADCNRALALIEKEPPQ